MKTDLTDFKYSIDLSDYDRLSDFISLKEGNLIYSDFEDLLKMFDLKRHFIELYEMQRGLWDHIRKDNTKELSNYLDEDNNLSVLLELTKKSFLENI